MNEAVAGSAVAQQKTEDATTINLPGLLALRGKIPRQRQRSGRRVSAPLSGGSSSRALGRGLDFAETREYYPGDDIRLIDWNVTARTGKPHTKVFNEEKERPFVVAVDLRSAMFFATRVAYKSVTAARLAALISWAAADNRHRVGGMIFSNDAINEVATVAGRRGVTAVLRNLVQCHDTQPNHPDRSDAIGHAEDTFERVLQRLDRRTQSGTSVCLISDFAGFKPEHARMAARLLTHCHVAAIQVYDPLERELPPPALYEVSDGARISRFDAAIDTSRQAYQVAFEQRTEALEAAFGGAGNSFTACCTTQSLSQVAAQVVSHLPGSV